MAKRSAVKTSQKRKPTTPATPAPKTPNPNAQALGRLGGARNTPAQQAARAKNVQRAGRPGRICIHCGEPVYGGHKDRKLDTTCPGRAWTWGEARTRRPTT